MNDVATTTLTPIDSPQSHLALNGLTWRNLVGVPSVHGQIPYAHVVQEELDRQSFSCIAVELPQGWESTTFEAVQMLPRISGVGARHGGFVVMPGDSLIEGVRQGLQRGIPTQFIDLDTDCEYPERSTLTLPDPYLIQKQGLESYFRIAGSEFRIAKAPTTHHLRNRHMAWRLARLCEKHERVLFICGASHWEEIVALLEAGVCGAGTYEDDRAQARSAVPGITYFKDNAVLNCAPWHGEIPFFRWLFWGGVSQAESLIAGLLDAAVRTYRYAASVRDVEKVLHYSARLARLSAALTPSLHDVLSASHDIVGATFAGEVLKTALSYPSQQDPTQLRPCFHGKSIDDFKARLWHPDSRAFNLEIVVAEFSETRRRNPRVENETGVQFSDNNWGRYGDEMERESAFLGAIVQNFLQSIHHENDQAVKFDGDMRGGVDVRETLRSRIADPSRRDIYVQEEVRAAQNDIGAVVLLFDQDEEEHDCECYTYGRHLAFGFTTTPRRSGATAKLRWGLLASLLGTYEGVKKQEVVAQLQSGEVFFPTYEECLKQILRFARKPRVLFVAAHPQPAWLQREAQRQGKIIHYIPISSLPETLVEEIRTYNVYFYPEETNHT